MLIMQRKCQELDVPNARAEDRRCGLCQGQDATGAATPVDDKHTQGPLLGWTVAVPENLSSWQFRSFFRSVVVVCQTCLGGTYDLKRGLEKAMPAPSHPDAWMPSLGVNIVKVTRRSVPCPSPASSPLPVTNPRNTTTTLVTS